MTSPMDVLMPYAVPFLPEGDTYLTIPEDYRSIDYTHENQWRHYLPQVTEFMVQVTWRGSPGLTIQFHDGEGFITVGTIPAGNRSDTRSSAPITIPRRPMSLGQIRIRPSEPNHEDIRASASMKVIPLGSTT